jgi:putative acetyltransferase
VSSSFTIRVSTPEDAEGILLAHYSAVHETAKNDYSKAILNVWSRPVDAGRIAARRTKMGTDKSIISFVAVDDLGKVLVTLGAIYVAASAGRRGVASALFEKLEVKARELGMKVLRMDSSLTAVPFYIGHGFRELERGTHRLADGLMMNCVVMEKTL